MIKTATGIKLFKLFTNAGVDNHKLFNDICDLVEKEKHLSQGHCDSEHYDVFVKLMGSENNAGWDDKERHSQRIDIIRKSMGTIADRSETFLP